MRCCWSCLQLLQPTSQSPHAWELVWPYHAEHGRASQKSSKHLTAACIQVLYALALVPVGFLADKADRPRLLAGGLVVWSVLTMVASKVPPPLLLGALLFPERSLVALRPHPPF